MERKEWRSPRVSKSWSKQVGWLKELVEVDLQFQIMAVIAWTGFQEVDRITARGRMLDRESRLVCESFQLGINELRKEVRTFALENASKKPSVNVEEYFLGNPLILEQKSRLS